MDKVVSVIVPVYKVPIDKLKHCINSILNQSYKKIEIILVDDGSPDTCPKICDDFKNMDDRVKVIHQKNKGLSGARNTGVINSNGEYFMFVDGDDYIDKRMCEEVLYEAIKDDVDIVCTKLINDSKNEQINFFPYKDKKVYSTEEEIMYLKQMLLNFNGNNNSACGKLIKKEFIIKNNIYHNERLKQGAEDLEFNFSLFSKANKIKIMFNSFYHCVYNDQSITRRHNEKNTYLIVSCFESIKEKIDDNDKDMLDWFYNRLLYVIVNTAISGYFSPTNPEKYLIQKEKYKKFLEKDILIQTLKYRQTKPIDKKRKFIIFFVKHNIFLPVKVLAKVRYKQKKK